jgi:hypothetical protein
MAFTDKFVSSLAGGGGAGSEGDPWTLTESFGGGGGGAGTHVHVKADGSYSQSAITIANAGTVSQLAKWSGYFSTPGDLEGQGRNADGTLKLTNLPAITITGAVNVKAFNLFEALNITGSVTNYLIGSTASDNVFFVQCSVLNTRSHAAAHAIQTDNNSVLINSDFECSGALHDVVARADVAARILGCRFKAGGSDDCFQMQAGTVLDSVFIGDASAVGIIVGGSGATLIGGNTFYKIGKAITFPNLAMLTAAVLYDNHATDNSEWLDNLYAATASVAVIEINNRTRDNVTARTGIGDGAVIAEIVADAGGDETDYVDAASENFRLIPAAPGKAAGTIAYKDCGAYQRQESGGASAYAL